jgi:hypothetical protein
MDREKRPIKDGHLKELSIVFKSDEYGIAASAFLAQE